MPKAIGAGRQSLPTESRTATMTLNVTQLGWHGSTGMEAQPACTFRVEGRAPALGSLGRSSDERWSPLHIAQFDIGLSEVLLITIS